MIQLSSYTQLHWSLVERLTLLRAALNKGSNDSTFILSIRKRERERGKKSLRLLIRFVELLFITSGTHHTMDHGWRERKNVREVLTTHPTFHVQRPPHHLIKLPAFAFFPFAYSQYSQFRVLVNGPCSHSVSAKRREGDVTLGQVFQWHELTTKYMCVSLINVRISFARFSCPNSKQPVYRSPLERASEERDEGQRERLMHTHNLIVVTVPEK